MVYSRSIIILGSTAFSVHGELGWLCQLGNQYSLGILKRAWNFSKVFPSAIRLPFRVGIPLPCSQLENPSVYVCKQACNSASKCNNCYLRYVTSTYDARLTKGGGERGSVEHRDLPSGPLPHITLVDARGAGSPRLATPLFTTAAFYKSDIEKIPMSP